ncbi:GspE/PulE family protein [Agitococcus lubricus]|uniref:General secretion pathway protein E n=1 Tax=Agitococcus lubricus TaxID=1077255 RepID=A0A2T5J239_9GAMM|nr:GspE/PulE family protein [Agitococcus lubricus]PTQ90502.1 general secretion pathway protein E [Agitococcus lubricus]
MSLVKLPSFDTALLDTLQGDFSQISYSDCLQKGCMVGVVNHELILLVSQASAELVTWASYRLQGDFSIALIEANLLENHLSQLQNEQQAVNQLLDVNQQSLNERQQAEISLSSIAQDANQVVRLVNSTLYEAHHSSASDIHLENTVQGLVIKYRIDGVLIPIRQLANVLLAEQVISRLKVMAELDIGEKRIPQDGRFAVTLQGREIDFRVSMMPGLFGEDAVLRILDKQQLSQSNQQLSLELLGFDGQTQLTIRRLAQQPYGLLLVTGPTGSGKTTTLYATLSEVNHGDDKIITIEDPVEYQLSGVLQIPVNERKGLTFAKGLRSILRHDPDKILVGEIRDSDTAEIAIQAALTGHLVFTSVHANNVFDVISRFRHMGIDNYSFVAALNGIVAQRLVRLLCPHCTVDDFPSAEQLAVSKLSAADYQGVNFKRGKGCPQCRGTGYKGRKALAEILVMTDELREAILQQQPISHLKALAQQGGTIFMREQAIAAVKRGETSLQEINRVTFVD